MKPIKLTFEGFSSYVDKQTIDFSSFSEKLFLIHGATGSGKTSMLDAITYVLYGQSSTASRGNLTSMRCQYATEDIVTSIEFEFYAGNNRYKFYRELKKVKRRSGEISYNENGNAFIYSKDEEYIPMCDSNKVNTVSAKAKEILGLDYNQFCQIILLPQGKFEEFLVSGSQEKENILRQLFNTTMWDDITNTVTAKVKALEEQSMQQKAQYNALFMPIECSGITEALELIKSVQGDIEQKKQSQKLAKTLLDEKRAELKVVTEQKQLQDDLLSAKNKLVLNQKRYDEYSDKAVVMDKCQRAEFIKPVYNNYLQSQNDSATFLKQDTMYSKKIIENTALLEQKKVELQNLLDKSEKIDVRKQRLQIYKNATVSYERVADLSSEIDSLSMQKDQLTKLQESLVQSMETLKLSLGEGKEKLSQIEHEKQYVIPQNELEITANEQVKKQYSQLLNKRLQLKEYSKELKLKNNKLIVCENEYAQLRQAYIKTNAAYLSSSAFMLADSLEKDKPCPVCGSTSHPQKAQKTEDNATYEQVSNALAVLDKKQTERTKLNSEVTALEVVAKQCSDEIDMLEQNADVVNFDEQKLQALYKTKEKLLENQGLLEKIGARVDKLQLQSGKHLVEIEQTKTQLTEVETKLSIASGKLSESKSSLIEGIADKKELVKRTSEISDLIERFENTKKSLDEGIVTLSDTVKELVAVQHQIQTQLKESDKRLGETKLELHQKLKEQGLDGISELVSLLAIKEDFSEVKQVLESLASEKVILKNTMMQCETKLGEEIDTEYNEIVRLVKEDVERLQLICSQYEKDITLQEHKASQTDNIIKKAQDISADMELKSERINKFSVFSRALYGEKGVSLSRYVLGVMMDNILVGANELLKNVHSGRYSLYRKVSGIGKGKKAGLELEIFDGMSGKNREVSTLSGGEKFLVALSLSFGLSTAVVSNSGGVDINTIFIDEGFGSLDENSLQDALDILSVIYKNNNRLVGIISHVGQLKEIITTKIEVVKTSKGSQIKI